jgi:hypothetical protein
VKHRTGALPQRVAAKARSLPWAEALIVVGAYLAVAILISWPLAANIGTNIAGGGSGGDQSGYVWDFWNHATNGLKLWGIDHQEAVGAPFGRESPASVNTTLFATLGPAWIVAVIWSPIVAYNVTVFLALTLSASVMYLLVRWVGAGRAPAAWAGAAFMVFPYVILRAHIHVPLTHIWGLPLVILGALFWLERPNLRRAGLMAAALLACWLTSPYYGTMGGLIVAVAVIVGFARTWSASNLASASRRAAEGVLAVGGIVLLPLGALFMAASGSIDDSLNRPRENLSLFGARLADYVVPPLNSSFFQGLFGHRWAEMGSVGGERTAFVGYVTLALAAVGVGAVIGARRWNSRAGLAVILSLAAIPVLVLFSLESPSTFFGRSIDMPSSYLFDHLPYMQAYARFSAAVMAMLLVVAAVGLGALIRNRATAGRVALVSGVFLLSAMELPGGAPLGRVIASDLPLRVEGQAPEEVPVWQWIDRNADDAIIFETPGLPNEFIERFFMYGQLIHGQRIVNGSLAGNRIGHSVQQANGFLDAPGVPQRLATLGVDYVTVHPWAYAAVGMQAPDIDAPPRGFSPVRSFPDGTAIWRVSARPDDAVAIPRSDGWYPPEQPGGAGGRVWRWMGDRSRTTVFAPRAGRFEIRFHARGLWPDRGNTYELSLVDAAGSTLGTASVRTEREVTFDVELPEGTSDLFLETSGPSPRPPIEGDPRRVTVAVSEWSLMRVD